MAEGTVLIVEDDDVIRDALRGALLGEKNVVCVSTVSAARRVLSAIRFDVVLLDLVLGTEHGEELLHWMANQVVAPSPVVVVSASREGERIANAYCVPFVAKPFELDVVCRVLQDAVASGSTPRMRA